MAITQHSERSADARRNFHELAKQGDRRLVGVQLEIISLLQDSGAYRPCKVERIALLDNLFAGLVRHVDPHVCACCQK